MATALVQIDDFLHQAETAETVLELDQGEVREMSSPSSEHQFLVLALGALLRSLVDLEQFRPSLGHGLVLAKDTARIPDLYVARRATFEAMRRRPGNYYEGCPELIIEIASPRDEVRDVEAKTRQYLEAGAQSVWFVYMESRTVLVRRSDGSVDAYAGGQSIPGPLFSIEVPVSEIFRDLD